MKIRAQILLVSLSISLLPLFITNSYIVYTEYKFKTRELFNHLDSVASIQKARLEAGYLQNIERVSLIASRTKLRSSLKLYHQSPDPKLINTIEQIIEDAAESIVDIAGVFVLGKNGELLAKTKHGSYSPEMLSQAFDTGRDQLQAKLFFRYKGGILHGAFSGPLKLQGEFLGVLVVVSHVENMLSSIADYSGLGESGETMLAMPNKNGDALFIAPTRFNKDAALNLSIPKTVINVPIVNAINGESRHFDNYIDYRGVPILAVTRYIPVADWGLVVKIDKGEAYRSYYQQIYHLLLMLIIIVVLVGLIAGYLAKKIMRPIEELTRVSKKIASGDMSVVVSENSENEVGELAESFNNMTEALAQTQDELMDKVLALKKNSDRFDRWTQSSFVGIYQFDKSGKIVDANHSFLSMLGHDRNELEGGKLSNEFITPNEYWVLDNEASVEVQERGYWQAYEKELLHKSGRRVPVLVSGTYYDEAKVDEYIAFVIDLTERNQSEARWQIALEGGDIGVWDWDLVSGKIFYSKTWRDILGFLDVDIDWRTLIHPDDKEHCLNLLEQHIEGSLPVFCCEHRLMDKEQGYRWVLSKAKVIERLKNQEPARIVGTIEDISNRKKTEIALSEHMELDRMISDVSSTLIKLNLDDLANGMTLVAEKIAEYLGADVFSVFAYTGNTGKLSEEFYWKKPSVFLPRVEKGGFDFDLEFPWLAGVLKNKTALFNLMDFPELPAEAVNEKKHIQRYGFKSFILIPLVAGGKPLGFIRCASVNFRPSWDELVVSFLLVIAESIAQLLERNKINEDLYRVQKMEAVGQLTGGIAHDFNNILGVILGNLELLERQFSGDEAAMRRLTAAINGSKRAAKLTKDLLAFSRKKVTEKVSLNINKALQDMEQLFVHTLAYQVDVTFELDVNAWSAELDPGDFQDACMNLLINARDAMPDGGVVKFITENIIVDRRSAELHIGLQPGDYVRLSVIDQGEGMSPQVVHHIFDPFFTTKPQGVGTGLGLSMVFGFVKRSGGYIDVVSKEGEGSRFMLYFPRSKLAHKYVDFNLKEEIILPEGQGNILVVDDEEALADLACEYLSTQGYQVAKANSGYEAIEILNKNTDIDLLFTDIMMPGGVNGYELAEQAGDINEKIKVLLTSGYAEQKNYTANQARFNDHLLAKPYSKKELLMRVSAMLSK